MLSFLFFFLFGSDLWDGVGIKMVQEANLFSKHLFLRNQSKILSYAASSLYAASFLLDDFFSSPYSPCYSPRFSVIFSIGPALRMGSLCVVMRKPACVMDLPWSACVGKWAPAPQTVAAMPLDVLSETSDYIWSVWFARWASGCAWSWGWDDGAVGA